MSEIVKLKREHLIPLLDQKENLGVKECLLGQIDNLEIQNNFALIINEKAAVCGGVLMYWEGRGQLWSVFNEDFKSNFVPVFRGMKAYMKEELKRFRRIEVSIPLSCPNWKRRVEMLGFTLECAVAKKYLPDGNDCSLYSMVRE